MITELLDEQKIKNRRRIKLRFKVRELLGVSLLVVALTGFLIWFVLLARYGSVFALRHVEVVGELKNVRVSEVVKLVDMKRGTNLLGVDIGLFRQRIGMLPWVRQVVVRRRLPDTLWIYIVEYEGRAILVLDDIYYVDREGRVFKKVGDEDEKNLPVITGVNVLDNNELLSDAIDVLDLFERTEMYKRYGVSEVHFDESKGITIFTMQGPVKLEFGSDLKDMARKLKRLDLILPVVERGRGKISYMDFSYDDKVVVKYRQ